MEAPQSRAELEANLEEYRAQLKQVEELLLMGEHVDDEMQAVYQNLTEVIQLTEELLKEAVEAEAAAGGPEPAAQPPAPAAAGGGGASSSAAPGSAPPSVSSLLPPQVAEQIKRAQLRAALTGQAPSSWLLGAKVQAIYSPDGNYYDATVESVTESGNLIVSYEGYAEREEVTVSSLRERPEKPEIYTGVAAPKRKRVEEQPVITELPKWLEIKEGDDEKTKVKKRKLIKSYKSKIRFQNMDLQSKKKADSWQDFMSGKGSKKKSGFVTGYKKESIFSVGEGVNAKVGVTGSGRGLTQYVKQKKVGPGGVGSEDGE